MLGELRQAGCQKVHFSGGEVFVRRDFLDLVEHAAGLGMRVNLTTNGTLLTDERVRRLVRARPNSVSISIDGPTAGDHEAVRGVPGAFRRTCRAIRRLHAYGERIGSRPRVRINYVVMRENFRRLPAMVRLAGELGAVELHPMPVDEKGPPRHRLSRGQIRRYNVEVAPLVLEERRRPGFSTHPSLVYPFGLTEEDLRYAREGLYARGFYERRPCLAPWTHLFIAWDGETYLCCMTNGRMESLGNLRASSVRDVFWGERLEAVRRSFMAGQVHAACHRCDMFLDENARLQRALSTASAASLAPSRGGPGS